MFNIKRLVLISLFITQAAAMNILEKFIVLPIAIPGVKLGLANIITVLAILILGWKETFLIVILRCIIAAMYGGNPISFLFSITGGILSTTLMITAWYKFSKYFSIVGISLIGAVGHNIGQLFIASLIIQDFRVYFYLPVLLVSALITGYIVGWAALHSYNLLSERAGYLLDLQEENR